MLLREWSDECVICVTMGTFDIWAPTDLKFQSQFNYAIVGIIWWVCDMCDHRNFWHMGINRLEISIPLQLYCCGNDLINVSHMWPWELLTYRYQQTWNLNTMSTIRLWKWSDQCVMYVTVRTFDIWVSMDLKFQCQFNYSIVGMIWWVCDMCDCGNFWHMGTNRLRISMPAQLCHCGNDLMSV